MFYMELSVINQHRSEYWIDIYQLTKPKYFNHVHQVPGYSYFQFRICATPGQDKLMNQIYYQVEIDYNKKRKSASPGWIWNVYYLNIRYIPKLDYISISFINMYDKLCLHIYISTYNIGHQYLYMLYHHFCMSKWLFHVIFTPLIQNM